MFNGIVVEIFSADIGGWFRKVDTVDFTFLYLFCSEIARSKFNFSVLILVRYIFIKILNKLTDFRYEEVSFSNGNAARLWEKAESRSVEIMNSKKNLLLRNFEWLG